MEVHSATEGATQHSLALNAYPENNTTDEVENTTANTTLGVPSPAAPPLGHTISIPTPSFRLKVPFDYNRRDEVQSTTANPTPMSFSAYSAEPRTNEAGLDQVPARDERKKKHKMKSDSFLTLPSRPAINLSALVAGLTQKVNQKHRHLHPF
jgi:hypothetical protein